MATDWPTTKHQKTFAPARRVQQVPRAREKFEFVENSHIFVIMVLMTDLEEKRQKEVMRFWLESARRDRDTARSLLESKHYDWSLFVFHLAIEKILKALVIQKEITPPFTHKLLQLVQIAGIEITEEQTDWLTEITEFNIEARYPDAKQEFYTKVTAEFAKTWHDRCESIFMWLEKLL